MHPQQITINSRIEDLQQVNSLLNKYISTHALQESLLFSTQLIAEELIVNTINYGYDGDVEQSISLLLSHNSQHITMTFIDRGKEFNPLEQGEARLGIPKEDEAVGGLGVHLIKEMSDLCHYEYVLGENRFTVKLLLE